MALVRRTHSRHYARDGSSSEDGGEGCAELPTTFVLLVVKYRFQWYQLAHLFQVQALAWLVASMLWLLAPAWISQSVLLARLTRVHSTRRTCTKVLSGSTNAVRQPP